MRALVLIAILALAVFPAHAAVESLTDEEVEELSRRIAEITKAVESARELTEPGGFSAWVIGSKTPMRKKPDEDAQLIGYVPQGTEVPVYSYLGAWFLMEYNDKFGWISTKDVAFALDPSTRVIEGYGYPGGEQPAGIPTSYYEYMYGIEQAELTGEFSAEDLTNVLSNITDLRTWLAGISRGIVLDGFLIQSTPPGVTFDFRFRPEEE